MKRMIRSSKEKVCGGYVQKWLTIQDLLREDLNQTENPMRDQTFAATEIYKLILNALSKANEWLKIQFGDDEIWLYSDGDLVKQYDYQDWANDVINIALASETEFDFMDKIKKYHDVSSTVTASRRIRK